MTWQLLTDKADHKRIPYDPLCRVKRNILISAKKICLVNV